MKNQFELFDEDFQNMHINNCADAIQELAKHKGNYQELANK